jgi:hypothetical protein
LSARLDLEDLRAMIGAYHRCAAPVIERTGGFVAKCMGDGVLAYFGYPRADEHDAERAVRAGLALVEAVAGIETAAGEPLQVRGSTAPDGPEWLGRDDGLMRWKTRSKGSDSSFLQRRGGGKRGTTHFGTESLLTLCWRELDSNFPYAGAMNLVFAPFVSRSSVRVLPEAHPTMAMRVTRPTRLAISPKATEHTRPTLVPPAMEAIIVGTSLRKLGLH